jgi:hypothetical protein
MKFNLKYMLKLNRSDPGFLGSFADLMLLISTKFLICLQLGWILLLKMPNEMISSEFLDSYSLELESFHLHLLKTPLWFCRPVVGVHN